MADHVSINVLTSGPPASANNESRLSNPCRSSRWNSPMNSGPNRSASRCIIVAAAP